MKANVGTADRVLRIGTGIALIGLALTGTIGPWGYLSVVPLVTGMLHMCPAYSPLGFGSGPNGTR